MKQDCNGNVCNELRTKYKIAVIHLFGHVFFCVVFFCVCFYFFFGGGTACIVWNFKKKNAADIGSVRQDVSTGSVRGPISDCASETTS